MNHTTVATEKAHTATLRLAGRLLTLLHTTNTPEAAALARTVSTNPSSVGLDTVERVSGLFGVPAHQFFREDDPNA